MINASIFKEKRNIGMPLERSDINNIAWLARLALREEEVPEYQRDLGNILGLVEEMQAVKTAGIAPLSHPLEIGARTRPDAVTETDQRDKFQQIAPETSQGYYLVPKVIE
jgi:aspartyl-tRNA(Asn)/glutamyl-tRNA(Gln) amidotransferase subunit C